MENPKPPAPGIRDWASFFLCLAFVVIGLFMARKDLRDALLPITFFGVCTLFFGYTIFRKLRRRRFTATTASVAGGVKLRGSNSRMLLLAAMIGVPGVSILVVPDSSLLILICGVIMLGASLLVIVGVLTGRIAARFLRFDPPGLTIGENKYEYFIPWDAISNVAEFEMFDNPSVGFDVAHPDVIRVTPESFRARLMNALANNQHLANRDVVILAVHFAVQAESLCAAITNYSINPGARADLVARPALAMGPGPI